MKPRYSRSMMTPVLIALALSVVLTACVDPIEIITPRREWIVNLDSLVGTDHFVRGPGDSIQAVVDGSDITFATEVQRSFHNGVYRNAHYVTVKASRQSLKNSDYDAMYLRLDAIRDTGVYEFNGLYSQPKDVDSLANPTYGALYERRHGDFTESYGTGHPNTGGTVHVARIDTMLGVMVGTFSFTGYDVVNVKYAPIARGAFRVQLQSR
ncbi:MAG: hypothetical protein H7X80_04220 [bacterium]|nr:hypothetical protein [Candidatus Kapabacteria bacterium]